jgi:putative spermidine/putrescine transport system substrate-binding protein
MRWSRTAAATIAALTVTLGMSACQGNGAGASSSDPKALNVYANGDTNVQSLWQDTLIPGFEKANPGVKVSLQFDLHDENSSQVLAKLSAATQQKKDPGLDLVEGMAQQAGAAGLLADPSSAVPNLAPVDAKVKASAGTNVIPYRGSSVLLAYDPAHVTNPPKTLDDLLTWIHDHPGKFAYNSPKSGGSGGAFVATVLDKYTPADAREQMTTGYHKELESNWDKGWAKLAELNKDMYQKGVYPNGNNGTLELLQSGQIWMAPVWSDQFLSGQETGLVPKTAKALQITDPSFTGGATGIGVPSASTKQQLAFSFANWVLEPAQQAEIATKIAGYPAIPLDKLPSSVQQKFASADIGELRPGYNSDHSNDINNLWEQKVPGH